MTSNSTNDALLAQNTIFGNEQRWMSKWYLDAMDKTMPIDNWRNAKKTTRGTSTPR